MIRMTPYRDRMNAGEYDPKPAAKKTTTSSKTTTKKARVLS